ncbi:MAG TPA: type II CAAX endopeptidase family protein [Chryseosolibacter sp.]
MVHERQSVREWQTFLKETDHNIPSGERDSMASSLPASSAVIDPLLFVHYFPRSKSDVKNATPLWLYIAVTFAVSWSVFIMLALNHHEVIFLFRDDAEHARTQDLWHALGGLGPLTGALVVLRFCYTKGNRRWFWQGYRFRSLTATGWTLALSPLILFAFALLLSRLIEHKWFDLTGHLVNTGLDQPLNLLAWLLPSLFYGFGEEAGWRGFALPFLQSKHSAFTATVILASIWACWHIPSFFYRYELKGVAYAGFLMGLFAGAVWLTFLYNYTKGSTLSASIWHLTFNIVSMLSKEEVLLSAIMSTTIMASAIFVLIRYKPENLTSIQRTSLIHSH